MVLGNILTNKDTLNLHVDSHMRSLCFVVDVLTDTEAN